MRITQNNSEHLELRGRRTDGEEGQQGLWLLWLVAGAFLVFGVGFHQFVPDGAMRTEGALSFGIGLLITSFGIFRFVRHEHLHLDRSTRTGRYSTRAWPLRPKLQFQFAFEDVKRLELRFKLESPAPGHRGPSPVYPTWEAVAIIKPRRKLSLERNKDEALVRELARLVAETAGAEVDDRTP